MIQDKLTDLLRQKKTMQQTSTAIKISDIDVSSIDETKHGSQDCMNIDVKIQKRIDTVINTGCHHNGDQLRETLNSIDKTLQQIDRGHKKKFIKKYFTHPSTLKNSYGLRQYNKAAHLGYSSTTTALETIYLESESSLCHIDSALTEMKQELKKNNIEQDTFTAYIAQAKNQIKIIYTAKNELIEYLKLCDKSSDEQGLRDFITKKLCWNNTMTSLNEHDHSDLEGQEQESTICGTSNMMMVMFFILSAAAMGYGLYASNRVMTIVSGSALLLTIIIGIACVCKSCVNIDTQSRLVELSNII